MKYLTKRYWLKRRQYKYILNWIDRAESYYRTYVIKGEYNHYPLGLCRCFSNTFKKTYLFNLKRYEVKNFIISYIIRIIPEFDYRFLMGNNPDFFKGYWWNVNDFESRYKAFNILRDIYTKKLKTL